MSVVGSYPLTLTEAALVHPEFRHYLNVLPGMTETQALDLGVRHPEHLNTLRPWSLQGDLKALLSVIPKLISKIGVD